MKQKIVLFGAGGTTRYAVRALLRPEFEPVAIVDNAPATWNSAIDGIRVMDVETALHKFPGVPWVASVMTRKHGVEIRAQLRAMAVPTLALWQVLDVCHELPPRRAVETVDSLCADLESFREFGNQLCFRETPDYDTQHEPSDIHDIYFPSFIQHRDDEHFVDCGAADGDTVRAFRERWANYAQITAFEPDKENYRKLAASLDDPRHVFIEAAVSDFIGRSFFTALNDYSSHLGGDRDSVEVFSLDRILNQIHPPTYIKMDIEGAELQALWGARRILKQSMPVLAICAYHESHHLWEIPLLIHAIQPLYRLYLRRYAEGAFELVWYAVPPERAQ